MGEREQKRRKAHPEVVDISLGSLHLRITQLERQVKYLQDVIDSVRRSPHVVQVGRDGR